MSYKSQTNKKWVSNQIYRKNYDLIFKKKDNEKATKEENVKNEKSL